MRLAALSILLVGPLASAQDSRPEPPVSVGAAEFFGRLRTAASSGDWARVSGRLEDPAVAESRDLVGHPDLPNVSIPLSQTVALLVRSLPPEGLRAIRESQDPTARLWFGEWQRTCDASHLRRILRERFYSSLGPAAADVLATQARERGDLAEAGRLWRFALENGIPDATWLLLAAKAAQTMAAAKRLDLVDRLADSLERRWMDETVIVDREPTKLGEFLRGLPSKDAPPGARMARQLLGDPPDGSATDKAVVVDHSDGPMLAVLHPGRALALGFRLRPDADPQFLWSESLVGRRPKSPNLPTAMVDVVPDHLTGGDGVVVSSSLQPPYLLAAVEAATGKPAWNPAEAIESLRVAWEGADLRASRPIFHSGRLYLPGLLGGGAGTFEAFVAAFDIRTGARL